MCFGWFEKCPTTILVKPSVCSLYEGTAGYQWGWWMTADGWSNHDLEDGHRMAKLFRLCRHRHHHRHSSSSPSSSLSSSSSSSSSPPSDQDAPQGAPSISDVQTINVCHVLGRSMTVMCWLVFHKLVALQCSGPHRSISSPLKKSAPRHCTDHWPPCV